MFLPGKITLIEVRPAVLQVDDLLEEIRQRTERDEAVLVTTLTKRMAEDLTEYYEKIGVKVVICILILIPLKGLS